MDESLAVRKRRRTRQTIADAALRLFLQRGFEQVTVAQIAAEAEVAEKTVFNHFRTKADLVFDSDQDVLDQLVTALRDRPPGQSAVTATRHRLTRLAGDLGATAPAETQAAFRRLVADSPALQAHQRELAARLERALADVLAEETGVAPGSPEPFVVAIALVGAMRAGYEAALVSGGRVAATNRALDLLETGLADYARTDRRN